jgi:hypothetical protein
MIQIADNLGNLAEADTPESAALAVETLLKDDLDNCTTIVVTKITSSSELLQQFDKIINDANEGVWGS